MTTPVIGVLAIQGDVREHRASLESAGATTTLVKTVAALNEVDGLVIPGGESTTMSILAIKNGLLEPLIAKRVAGLPMYGSCAGLIMLADRIADGRSDQRTIGGIDITATRNAFGRQVDSFETDLHIPAIGEPDFHAIFIRAPLVTEIGEQVEIIATMPNDEKRIVAVRQNNLLATSFHPEITQDHRIHKLFVDMVRKS